jgi:biopolymer transport protein TolR
MARRSVVSLPEAIYKVNVTPIIDVALVLVIILLVTAPMMSVADLPVDLPSARTREAEDERNLSVTLAYDGSMAVDEQRVTADQLAGVLAQRLSERGNDNVLVIVRADTNAPYSSVRRVLDDARHAGAKRLAIATRQATEKRP